jgi:cell division septum initiation protein DivIVA
MNLMRTMEDVAEALYQAQQCNRRLQEHIETMNGLLKASHEREDSLEREVAHLRQVLGWASTDEVRTIG